MGKAYPYYECRKKDCEYYGKSIPLKETDAEFASVLEKLITTNETVLEIKEVFLEK